MQTRAREATALALASLLGACGSPAAERPEALDAVRSSTEQYRDVKTALADGYVRDWLDACETPYHMGITEDLGVMGIHFLRRDLLGIDDDETRLDVTRTHIDFLQPAALVYEPQADGSLELVALENLVSAAAWEAGGDREPPSFYGIPFEFRAADPGMMTHAQYDLHIWLYRENPSGMFAAYNSNATCQHHVFNMPMIHPGDPPHSGPHPQ